MPLSHNFKTLTVENLHINSFQRFFLGSWQYYETVHNFSYTFEFGKSYLLDAKPGRGAWAISWAIGGLLYPAYEDTFFIDGQLQSTSGMRGLSWCFGNDGHEKWWHFPKKYKSVSHQIKEALQSESHISEQELVEAFELSKGRYNRPLYQHSGERWRSSFAIGYARGRVIYCFPHLDLEPGAPLLTRRNTIEYVVQFLTDKGALVIIPAIYDEEAEGICDVVVSKSLIDSNYQKHDES